MTQDSSPNHRAPSLGGNAAHRPTNNEPSLSLDRLLPGLREALESSDRGQRLETIEQIIEGGSERVVPLLVELLQDVANARSRQRIVAMLGQLGDVRAVKPLADLLADADPGLRKVAAWALGQIGAVEGVDALLAQLEHESNSQVAGAIILSLARIGDLRALPILSRFIDDPSSGPLAETAWTALKILGSTCRLEHLTELLYSDSETVRQWAADRFVHHSETLKLEHLPLLEKLLLHQERADVRHRAVYFLAALEDQRAREIVLQTLTHADDRMRLAAFHAVRDYRIQEALDILLSRCADETGYYLQEAIAAIGAIDNPRVMPFLLNLIEEGNNGWTAALALQSRSEVNVPQLLLERLQCAVGEARYHILHVLHAFNTPEVIITLLDITRSSKDERERCRAIESIYAEEYPEFTRDLVDILRGELSVAVRVQTIWALNRCFNAQAGIALRTLMAETDNDELRTDALSVLLSNEVPDAAALLHEQLDLIKDEEALASIAHYVHLLGEEAGLSIAERLYRTAQTESLRDAIVSEMEHFNHENAVLLVIDALRNDGSANVRLSAVHTLGHHGSDTRIVEALIEALSDTGRYYCSGCEEEHRLCDTVANYLAQIQSLEATAALAAWQSTQQPDSEPMEH